MDTAVTDPRLDRRQQRGTPAARPRAATGVLVAFIAGLITSGFGLWSTQLGAQPLLKLAKASNYVLALAQVDDVVRGPSRQRGRPSGDAEAAAEPPGDVLNILYHYDIGDLSYQGRDERPLGTDVRDVIAVYYNPQDPTESFVEPSAGTLQIAAWCALVAIGVLSLLVGIGLLFTVPSRIAMPANRGPSH